MKIIQTANSIEFQAESDWEKKCIGRILDNKSICKIQHGTSHTRDYPGRNEDHNLLIEIKEPDWGT